MQLQPGNTQCLRSKASLSWVPKGADLPERPAHKDRSQLPHLLALISLCVCALSSLSSSFPSPSHPPSYSISCSILSFSYLLAYSVFVFVNF